MEFGLNFDAVLVYERQTDGRTYRENCYITIVLFVERMAIKSCKQSENQYVTIRPVVIITK